MINQAIEALRNEDKISSDASREIEAHIARTRNEITSAFAASAERAAQAMTDLANAIAQHHAERSQAIAGIIGQPVIADAAE